ncbi:MAG: metal-binding protein [Leptolyngbya sp.]|nr:MAG: metal-binding protein [Leptolyngbya sp.]
MKAAQKTPLQVASTTDQIVTLGDYAHSVISEQYRSIFKYEKKVLADNDPEDLHHMRVGTRKLRTALQVFGMAVQMPKHADSKRVGSVGKVLGKLRDLDVQIAALEGTYLPLVDGVEEDLLHEALQVLYKQRRKAFDVVERTLARSRYQDLKTSYQHWLENPKYTSLATLPIIPLLPDLLSPLLADLLLHPGWLIPASGSSAAGGEILHDLRKACKHVRYQAEFFVPFYSQPFQDWIQEIKSLQDNLGKLQDSYVLQDLLKEYLPKRAEMPSLQATIHQTRFEALADWDRVRQQYLDPAFRSYLHQMLLEPVLPVVEPIATPDPAPASTHKRAAAKKVSKTTTKTSAVRKQ